MTKALPGVFLHPQSLVETTNVGAGTRVWAFAHILSGATIGRDGNICDHVFIENDVIVGDRVTVKSGVQLWDGMRVHDDVFIGPNVTFTNDLFPRSGQREFSRKITVLEPGCSVGGGATVLGGVVIGALSMVGAGAVVVRNVPPRSVVVGNPARVIRQLDDPAQAWTGNEP